VKEVLVKRLSHSVLFIFILLIAVAAMPAFAGVVPSKTAANQSVAQRDADLAVVRDVVAHDEVAAVLAQHGLSQQQVNEKVAQLSQQDLHQLAQNLNQLQAAGLTKQEWWWVGIGALAALILVVALS
jgi:TolA-binding protein